MTGHPGSGPLGAVRYVDEFRDGALADTLSRAIRAEADPGRAYRLMEFCGGHTHAIFRYGLIDLLPGNVTMVHGPGCPVCVLPISRMDQAIQLARDHGVILCTYGDLLRVPGIERDTLLKARAHGADVRMVYSSLDALSLARSHPDREVVFFAIGFETTTPPTAVALLQARAEGLGNFSVHCNHVLTPAAISGLLASARRAEAAGEPGLALDGFVGPAHVSAVIGSRPFERFAFEHRTPVVIAGFEPLDVMQAILMLIRQLNDGRAEVENEYTRVVCRNGNRKAQALMAEVFQLRPAFEWRGLGTLPDSALRLRDGFADFDAERRFALNAPDVADSKACECAAILRGVKKPTECRIFATACTPDNPIGACMVSSEGACAAYYTYGRYRDAAAERVAQPAGT
ncbi:MAG: hydrogenase formation protein HypD [Rhodospirillales bacterium]|nr:MAG: hydrogenase formation protein HypD [Rhodospirillales bacterium]